MDKPLVNRVAESGIITINLEEFFPQQELAVFDIKNHLFKELLLREKDFREAIQQHDWTQYANKNLAIYCSNDAIVPMWAFQLVAISAQPYAARIICGTPDTFLTVYYLETLSKLDLAQFQDKRIVVKGCSDKPVPAAAYTEIARLLTPIAKTIMYGEPCSTVPLFKKK